MSLIVYVLRLISCLFNFKYSTIEKKKTEKEKKEKENEYNCTRRTYFRSSQDRFAPNSLLWSVRRSENPGLAWSPRPCTRSDFLCHPRPFSCAPARLLPGPGIPFRSNPSLRKDFYTKNEPTITMHYYSLVFPCSNLCFFEHWRGIPNSSVFFFSLSNFQESRRVKREV